MVMAQFGIGMHQHRYQGAETLLQNGIAIDVDDIHGKAKLVPQRGQRSEHLLAQVAVAAAIERKPQRCWVRIGRAHALLTCRSRP